MGILWCLCVTQVWGQQQPLREVGLFIPISFYSLYSAPSVSPLFGCCDEIWEMELFAPSHHPRLLQQLPAELQLLGVGQASPKCSLSLSSGLGEPKFLAPVVWPGVGEAQSVTSICWGDFGGALSRT